MHLPKTTLNGLQALANELKGLAQALLKRMVELLIHGFAHLIQFLGIVLLDDGQLLLDRALYLVELFLVRFDQLSEPL